MRRSANPHLERKLRRSMRKTDIRAINPHGHLSHRDLVSLRRTLAASIENLRTQEENHLTAYLGKPKVQKTGQRHLNLLTDPAKGYIPLMYQDLVLRTIEAHQGRLTPRLQALHARIRRQMLALWAG